MLYKRILCIVGIVLLGIGCSKKESVPESSIELSQKAQLGKKVYDENGCADCHETKKFTINGNVNAGIKIPNLENPFLANDSSFIVAHFKTIEESKMPPIKLSEAQISDVSRYIAELHVHKNAKVKKAEADGTCPVCKSPLLIKDAEADGHFIIYMGKKAYFECGDCKEVYSRAPAAFLAEED